MQMSARVGGINGRWSHLIADSQQELHAFAARLGLKRQWFQDPMTNMASAKAGRTPKPGSYEAESWHYDVTASKRALAIRLGAVPIEWTDTPDIIRARMARKDIPSS
jgi:hypothetical protein